MSLSISYIYSITDRYSSKLGKIRKATNRFATSAKKATSKVKSLTKGMANLQNTASAAAIGVAALFPIKKAMDFEFAMADVLKVLDDITPAQLKALKKEIFATSVAMGRLPKDIVAVVAAGGRLGIPIGQLGEFTRLATRTSVAFDVVESVAGDSLASIKDKLGLTIDETGNLMDAINHLADNTSAKAGGMIEIIGRLSGTMKTVEMPPEMIAGWAALADRVEVTPRLAASGMKMMMRTMKTMPGMMDKLLAAPSETMSDYLKQLAKIDKVRLPQVLEKIFGAEAAGFVEKLVGKIGLLEETLALVADKTKLVGSMQRELNKKLSTGKVKWERIKAVFEILAIVIGGAILPLIKAITPAIIKIGEKLKVFAAAHPDLSKFVLILGIATAAFTGVAIAVGLAVTVLGGLATPILIAYGAIIAIVGAFTLFTSKNEKLRAAMGKLWDVIKVLFEPLEGLYKLTASLFNALVPGIAFVNMLAGSISFLADVLKSILSPFKALVDMSKQLAQGEILGALKAVGEALKGYKGGGIPGSILGILGEKAGKALRERFKGGVEGGTAGELPINQRVAAQNARVAAGTLNGNIMVSAESPAKVKRVEMETDMPGDLGFNLAPAY